MASRGEVGLSSRLFVDLLAATYQAQLGKHCRGRLLDLGCGFVPLFGAYKNFVDENVCVDWDRSVHNSEHVDITCDLTQPLPLADEQFQTILLSDVLEHIPEPMHVWHEMARLLKQGGKAIVNVPFVYWLHEQPHDYYRYTEYALRRFALLSGFEVDLLLPLGGTPEVLTVLLSRSLLRLGVVGSNLAACLQSACWTFTKSTLGAKLSARTSASLPLAYFMVATKR